MEELNQDPTSLVMMMTSSVQPSMHQGDFVVFRTEPEKGEQSLRYNERSERPD
jgi:hypothetical protein